MRILFLDDMNDRHQAAAGWCEGHDFVPVWNSKDAIAQLKGPKFDLVMLDHDLAEGHYLTLSEGLNEGPTPGETRLYAGGTGMDVVDFLVEQKLAGADNSPSVVIVHSWNPSRSIEMWRRLLDAKFVAYKVPFNHWRAPFKLPPPE